MKNSFFRIFILLNFCLLTFAFSLQAQPPLRFSYQSILRNPGGQALSNQPVGMRLSILQGSESGTAVYVETHNASTNASGLVTLQVGGGTQVSGSIATIDWAAGPYFIKTETDPEGGSNYSISGTSQLLSVPYALYSANGTPGPQGPQGPAGPQGATGPAGPQGATGVQGPAGPDGPTGAQGATGAAGYNGINGTNGADGKTILSGSSNPIDGIGNNGDFFLNTNSNTLFGPKASGAWPSNGVFLVGPQGQEGQTGATGPQGPPGGGGFVHYLGEQFGGGVVFQVYKDGSGAEHGLIVAIKNQSNSQAWSNVTDQLAGATSSWNGLANSNAIVAQAGHTSSAAKLCLDYEAGGFSDWYLPSMYEIGLLRDNLYYVNKSFSSIPGAKEISASNNGGYYWSSSESSASSAQTLYFRGDYLKYLGYQVRAVRAF